MAGSTDPIIHGMAEILWGSAWADHVEETRCCNLSGCEITSIMPPIGESAHRIAEYVRGRIEERNGCGVWSLCRQARIADAVKAGEGPIDPTESPPDDYAQRFGNCLMWMAMGAGVSWFDDHAKFPLKVPLCAEDSSSDLESDVAEACGCAPSDE